MLGNRFVKVLFAELLDFFLLLLANLGRVFDAIVLEVGIDEFLGDLSPSPQIVGQQGKIMAETCADLPTYIFGVPLQIVLGQLVLEPIDNILDMWKELDKNQ